MNEDRKIKEYLTSLSFGSKSQLLKDDVIFEDGGLGIMTDDEIVDILGAPLSRLKELIEESDNENEEVEEIDEIE